MTPYILFFVFILGSLVQAEEKVQTDSGKNSDLEFAKLLEKKFRNDFLVSFEDHKYAVTDLLAHQKLLLLKAKAGTNTDAETFAAFTKSAMEQTLAMGLTETCALLGDEAMTEIMEMNDKGRLKDKDYFFIISLLMIHAEVENENFHYATQVAAGVRMDARSSIEKSPAKDPGSIEAWDLHLKYLVGRFILPDDEIQKARKRINELISTKVSNPRTDLRQTLLRLNALEAA